MPRGFGGVVLVCVGRWEEVCAARCGAEHCGELMCSILWSVGEGDGVWGVMRAA